MAPGLSPDPEGLILWPGPSLAPCTTALPSCPQAVLSLIPLTGPDPDPHLQADVLAQHWPILREVPNACVWGYPQVHPGNSFEHL